MPESAEPTRLFPEFLPSDKAQWQEQVWKDLKGKAYDTLLWETEEGFVVEPFYTGEDTAHLPLDVIQAAQPTSPFRQWQNREVIPFTNEKTSRAAALLALSKGADALVFDV